MRRSQSEGSWKNHNRIRLIVLHEKPEAALGLIETLGFVDLLPLLAVTPEHADRLADCDVEGILRIQAGAAELSLEDAGHPVLRRWTLLGQSDIQVALTVRDLMIKAGRSRSLVWGPLEIHPRLFRAFWMGAPLQLSPLQLRLMTLLVAAEGEVVTRQQIAARVFGDSFDRSGDRLDAHVRRLRQLLEDDPAHPRFLLTVRGEGLRLGDVSPSEVSQVSPGRVSLGDVTERPGRG
ncbi:hypothetical protein GCM10009789_56720 [Kribbella sancticallisti]|uniref:OmpR/PhoB-type domain-containing protein n=1 Tax=Kribbella sancticallisti TaxID=460087 RepID=A0ABP4Q3T2_9ACTN